MASTDTARFRERVRHWAGKLNARVTSITVRPMTTKWASCSTAGRLTFDFSLLVFRKAVQDYVIVHELLHLHIPNHGKLWKSLMRAHLGDYEKLATELNGKAQQKSMAERRPSPSGNPRL